MVAVGDTVVEADLLIGTDVGFSGVGVLAGPTEHGGSVTGLDGVAMVAAFAVGNTVARAAVFGMIVIVDAVFGAAVLVGAAVGSFVVDSPVGPEA